MPGLFQTLFDALGRPIHQQGSAGAGIMGRGLADLGRSLAAPVIGAMGGPQGGQPAPGGPPGTPPGAPPAAGPGAGPEMLHMPQRTDNPMQGAIDSVMGMIPPRFLQQQQPQEMQGLDALAGAMGGGHGGPALPSLGDLMGGGGAPPGGGGHGNPVDFLMGRQSPELLHAPRRMDDMGGAMGPFPGEGGPPGLGNMMPPPGGGVNPMAGMGQAPPFSLTPMDHMNGVQSRLGEADTQRDNTDRDARRAARTFDMPGSAPGGVPEFRRPGTNHLRELLDQLRQR